MSDLTLLNMSLPKYRRSVLLDDDPTEPMEPVDLDNEPLTANNVDITLDVPRQDREFIPPQPDMSASDIFRHNSFLNSLPDNSKVTKEALLLTMERMNRRLDYLDEMANRALMNGDIAGTEGFLSFIAKAALGVLNIIRHVIGIFTTGLFYGWRDFKRSELSDYFSSKRASIFVLYRHDASNFEIQEFDCPRGMATDYKSATDALLSYADRLDMGSRAGDMKDLIKDIFKSIEKNNVNSFSGFVAELNRELVPKWVVTDFEELGKKYFTNKSVDKKAFSSLFYDTGTFSKVVDNCMDGDSYLRSVAGVADKLNDINDILNDLVSDYANNLTPVLVKELTNIVRSIANTFEYFSVAMNDLSRVDHNLTMNLRQGLKCIGIY